MRAFLSFVFAAGMAAVAGRAAWAADPLELPGMIEAVTVYRGQALVTRLVDIPGPAGLKYVAVTNLPDQVEPGSIYAEGEAGVQVQSVSYSARPVENDVRADVQKLDDQIRDLSDKIAANQRHHQLLDEQKDYLGKLEQFSAGTAAADNAKGALNAETLKTLTEYEFEKRAKIADDDLKLNVELRNLNAQLQTAQQQRAQVASSSSKLAREAKIFVNLAAAGGKMRVRYIVDNATWVPSYNVRATSARDKVTVEYLASIQQLTGEDWSNVAMTLSTATPSLVAKAPVLTELALTTDRTGASSDVLTQIEQSGGYSQRRQDLQQQREAIEQFRGSIGNNSSVAVGNQAASNTVNINGTVVNLDYIGDNNDVDLILNKTAGDLQLVDLLAKERIARAKDGKPLPLSPDEGLAITYQVKNRTSLQSRSDRQQIKIDTIALNADFYKMASPVLGASVYDEATAVNTSDTVFLWGDVATYMDNEFVGRGVMPSVASGQRFSVGLGVDSSLHTRRTLVEKTDSPRGANRVVSFTYRLEVENFASKPAKVRLLDRLPTSKDTDIKVDTVDTVLVSKESPAVSTDVLYEQTDAKKGILRWDLTVAASATDEKAAAVEYSFKLEYANAAVITTPAPAIAPAGQNGGGGAGGGGRGGFGGGGGGGGFGRGGGGGRGPLPNPN